MRTEQKPVYEIIFDIHNKPYSERAINAAGLKALIKKGLILSEAVENFDIQVFKGDLDITETPDIRRLITGGIN